MIAAILLFSLLFLFFISYIVKKQPLKDLLNDNYSIALVVGVIVSVFLAILIQGHPTDIGCFKGWSQMLYSDGFAKFYSSDAFTDYPPGYMYVLYIIGWLQSLFNLDYNGNEFLILVKMPAIMANLLTGLFLYQIAIQKTTERNAIILMLFYTLNPSVLFNASIWGQVDSIHTLILVVSIYFVTEKKLFPGVLLFTLGVLFKPQSFMFTPIYLYAFYVFLKDSNYSSKAFRQLTLYGFGCIALLIALILPFSFDTNGKLDLTIVLAQYVNTLGSYNYFTVNAYNIYGLLQLNWAAIDKPLLGIDIGLWNVGILFLIVLFSIYSLKKCEKKSNYFFTAALINLYTFMFSIKMHERYSFPVIAFLLIAYLYNRDKRLLYAFFGVSAAFFINIADVLRVFLTGNTLEASKYTAIIFSLVYLLVFVYIIFTTFEVYLLNQKKISCEDTPENDRSSDNDISIDETAILPSVFFKKADNRPIQPTEPVSKMNSQDYLLLLVITLIYGFVAFFNLGNTSSPQTLWRADKEEFAVIDLGSEYQISRMQYLPGPRHAKKAVVALSSDGNTWFSFSEFELTNERGGVFSWNQIELNSQARFVRITSRDNDLMLMEIAFKDNQDNLIPIPKSNVSATFLYDEQDLVPEKRTYMNSTYFDEIYHARTAYEFNEKLSVYEWTHPPLGKVIISWSVAAFGMTPFGWRFAGTAFGVLMLPLIYIFAKRIFRQPNWAAFTTIIFAFDFMHYTQTRIATIDTYITFFVIAMYYFMYRYYQTSFYDTPFKKTLIPLFLSGLCMGLGIACKWPGIYAGAGLALLFFITLFQRFKEYRFAKAKLKQAQVEIVADESADTATPESNEPDDDQLRFIKKHFVKYTISTCIWCILFFVIIPVAIYLLSYIPYYDTQSLYANRDTIRFIRDSPFFNRLLPDNAFDNYIAAVVQNQLDIFNYHSKLESTHAFSSKWYEWILNIRPIFYYSETVTDTIKAGISAFGNPAVWWAGIIAFGYTFWTYLKQRDKIALFLILGYLAQLVFWIPITRTTYIYHYFPCVPFLVLMIAYMFKKLTQRISIRYAYLYFALVLLLFLLFYPVISGSHVLTAYVNFLRWIPGKWQFL